jgi:glycosidase
MLTLARSLISLRKASPALRRGTYRRLPTRSARVFAYVREEGGDRRVVGLNFGPTTAIIELPEGSSGQISVSTGHACSPRVDGRVEIGPEEGVLVTV